MITWPKPRDWRQFEEQLPKWTNVIWLAAFAPVLGFGLMWYGIAVVVIGRLLLETWGLL